MTNNIIVDKSTDNAEPLFDLLVSFIFFIYLPQVVTVLVINLTEYGNKEFCRTQEKVQRNVTGTIICLYLILQ